MEPDLNPEQRRAVEHGRGPLLILAGAGSGKTRVLTARVARLIREEETPAGRILAVTFTNRAAGEMRERIAELLGREPHGLWAGTFHSVAARILRREADLTPRDRNFTIYDRDDSLRTVKLAMEEAGIDADRWSPASLLARISDAKNALVGPEAYEEREFDPLARRVRQTYPRYQAILRRSNAFDFDDLLVQAVRLLEGKEAGARYAERFRHVLVDEYQDTNHAQYRMVRALARRHQNLCVVGDDDQAVYGWRGADIRNILDFERDFPDARVLRLERNYRSTASILDAANAVIANNRHRKHKELHTGRGPGEKVSVVRLGDEKDEARWTAREIHRLEKDHPPGSCAILYRTNAQSRPYEEALRSAGLPYRIVGGVRFYERREIRDALAYLKLTVNPADDVAFLRVVNWPRRGIGAVTLERLGEARRADESLLAAASRAGEIGELPAAGARSLEEFAGRVLALHERQRREPAEKVVRRILQGFAVRSAFEGEKDGEERIANIDELVAGVAEFDPSDAALEPHAGPDEREASELELFLQHVSLLTDIDRYDPDRGAVSLLTVHNAKGLEFPVVFIGGLEGGLFPLSRAADSPEEYEEERRLLYVGMTRAMDRLYLTHAGRRWRYGSGNRMAPSPFLDELPDEPIERRIAGKGRRRGFGSDSRRRGRSGVPAPRGRREGENGAAASDGRFAWRRREKRGGQKAADASGSLRYDYSDSQEPLELVVDTRVVHPRFGEGTVLSVTEAGFGRKAEIEFDEVGRKKLSVAHADLRRA